MSTENSLERQATDPANQLAGIAPFQSLDAAQLHSLAASVQCQNANAGETIFREGSILPGLFVVISGTIEIHTNQQVVISYRGPGDVIGERGLLRDGVAMLNARATEPCELIVVPADSFHQLEVSVPAFGRWFNRYQPSKRADQEGTQASGLMSVAVSTIMTQGIISCESDVTVQASAAIMRDQQISSVLVMRNDALVGIVTVHDLVSKVLAGGLGPELPVADVMTTSPFTIKPDALVIDALLTMAERKINHLPVADEHGRIVGMLGRTDLFRQQASTASHMASELVQAGSVEEMAAIMTRLPDLLVQLISVNTTPSAICRRITDLTDVITTQLLKQAEARLGPPPVPYVWAACGSQGRREQTGVSDQDNCLILDDSYAPGHADYFRKLARFVCDGLNTVGFVYCPGEMMAVTDRWRQPLSVWCKYFRQWIEEPDTEAQMLASVMFDLRPVAGKTALFEQLQEATLHKAADNSIFVRDMIGNSLKHTPPLGFFRGLSLIRSGEHKDRLDLKHAGVVPFVDLARVYALKGSINTVNTRERLLIAGEQAVISESGARDLVDAYDVVAETRLQNQARQIQRGEEPDNFLDPQELSDFERNHLRDAFLVVRTMQSALENLI